MSKLFEDSDSEIEIKTENEYAKSYDTWRKKEELNKFKARHGEHALDFDNDEDDEDTSDDDENAVELTQEVEKDFYKTLALLKTEDPSIYDDKVVFFNSSNKKETAPKTKKEKKMFLRDYERELLLEKGGIASDSDDENRNSTHSFGVRDENKLKESFKVLDEDSDEDIGSFLKAREQTKEEEVKKEEDYKAWLIGQEKKLKDKETASSLKPLKDYWNNDKLDEGEKFLRDYLLNNRYLEEGNKNYIPTYNEIVQDLSEDENEIQKQEEFEHKYNFRFEEPDHEFIKRYPRTIEGSLRREDNRRKVKRQEIKERKAREKEEKMEQFRKLRDLKQKEIEEKIEKLKEITGNKEIAFNDEDIEGDFDPEEHDKRMQALFNDEYYDNGPEEDIKPPIDLDDEDALELQPENYDDFTGPTEEEEADGPHCEDDDFIMDADYDPKATQKELVENSRRKKKRKRKSKFVEMLAKERPKFDPMDKSYEKYIDEYYKFDCEDIIDDIPFKFKYRKVVPNSFGLSVEEILLAKDRELNKWCSLKKAVALRDEQVEKYEQTAYERKGQNIVLKKKILPSLFVEAENNDSKSVEVDEKKEDASQEVEKSVAHQENNMVNNKSPSKGKKLSKENVLETQNPSEIKGESIKKKKKKKSSLPLEENEKVEDRKEGKTKKRKLKTEKQDNLGDLNTKETVTEEKDAISSSAVNKEKNEGTQDSPLENVEISSKKKKKKPKKDRTDAVISEGNEKETPTTPKVEKKKKNHDQIDRKSAVKRKLSETSDNQKPAKKSKKNKLKNLDIGISDSRIACFGWNPKKFKNKLIYGNKDQ
ncbi:protein KRI1 homolog [Coccinella septempunctata]|uniref:protein KRI1 homolog n=1 Tax=Coccinella septempunctata TaxID=41139 RepID=UPI001D069ED4|nr:protein KRI1 homolog [Coccinella septempunctata]